VCKGNLHNSPKELELRLGRYIIDQNVMEFEMYRKILVPLDKSIKEAEGVLTIAQDLLSPDGEGILLHVIQPGVSKTVGLQYISGIQSEEEDRRRTMGYLNYFAKRLNEVSGSWRSEVVVSSSVTDAIVDFAVENQVDRIVMYTHDRKGLN